MTRWLLPLAVLAVVLVSASAVLVLAPADGTPRAAANQSGPVELSLDVVAAPNVNCGASDKPDTCRVDLGSVFTLTVDTNALPAEGFSGYQLKVVHAGLISKALEFVNTVDFVPLGPLGIGTETFTAGGISSLSDFPLPKRTYLGSLVKVDINCTPGIGTFKIAVPVPTTDVIDQNGDSLVINTVQQGADKVADTLTINCSDEPIKLPFPGDTDGDGCADTRENQPKSQANLGGGRDWLDPADYYDVSIPRDGVIDLTNDILGVILHYAPTGTEPTYDANYDRGRQAGPNPWNMAPPDGVIDLSNDILGVIQQYLHNCLP